jgi:hypothetical protein
MEGKFTIYRLTAPSGQCYVGMTRTSLQVRWLQHVKRAFGEQKQHPLYNAIREYGANAFLVRAIDTATDMETAQRLEQKYIAMVPRKLSFNLSPGGACDSKAGVKMFWARMDADPVARRVYLKKLSDIKKANDWTDYKALAAAAEKWRKEHARENYERLTRASRMTRWMRQKPSNADARSRKEKLLWKYKRGEMIRINTTALWNRRTPEERMEVAQKISATQKQIWAVIEDPQRRSVMTARARASVNRAIQGPAASKGLKRFWDELRADPDRYEAYMVKRTASLMKTLGGKST